MYKVGQSSIYRESIKRNELGRLAEEAPLQFPRPDSNTDRQYHALSRGLIMNELFRRVDKRGRTIGEALREDVAGPLKVDVLIGGITEEEDKRTVKLKVKEWKVAKMKATTTYFLQFSDLESPLRLLPRGPTGRPWLQDREEHAGIRWRTLQDLQSKREGKMHRNFFSKKGLFKDPALVQKYF